MSGDEDRLPARPPGLWTSVAVTKPVIDATAPTDRSMPPVSIVSVWQPARIAERDGGPDDDVGPVGADDARVERSR